MAEARFDGEPIKFGDRELIVPSLTYKQVRALWPKILGLQEGVAAEKLPERYGDIAEILFAAVSRNYDDITKEQFDDLLDTRTSREKLRVVLTYSGVYEPGPRPVADQAIT